MAEITAENATEVAAALLAELDADDHSADEEVARKKQETRRKRAELQQMIEQSEAYQEKKRVEETRKAAIEAQEAAFAQHIQPSADELKTAAEAYQDWQRRVDEFVVKIESRSLELQREGVNLSTHIDQIARSFGEQMGSFNWNHELTHNSDVRQAFVSFANRIKQIIPSDVTGKHVTVTAEIGTLVDSASLITAAYTYACNTVRRTNYNWLGVQNPEWRQIR